MSVRAPPLLSLPAECRLTILRYVFRSTTIPIPKNISAEPNLEHCLCKPDTATQDLNAASNNPSTPLVKSLSVLLVNRQIHREAQPLMLPSITLLVDQYPNVSPPAPACSHLPADLIGHTEVKYLRLDRTLMKYGLTAIRHVEIPFIYSRILDPPKPNLASTPTIDVVTESFVINLLSITVTGYTSTLQDLFPSSANAILPESSGIGPVREFKRAGTSPVTQSKLSGIKKLLKSDRPVDWVTDTLHLEISLLQPDQSEVEAEHGKGGTEKRECPGDENGSAVARKPYFDTGGLGLRIKAVLEGSSSTVN